MPREAQELQANKVLIRMPENLRNHSNLGNSLTRIKQNGRVLIQYLDN